MDGGRFEVPETCRFKPILNRKSAGLTWQFTFFDMAHVTFISELAAGI